MMTKFLIALLLIGIQPVISQDVDDDYEFRKKQRRKINTVDVDIQHVFKFTPTQMMVGELNFGYERKLDSKSTIEFEVGPTISEINGFGNNNHFYFDMYWNPVKRNSMLGVFGSVAFRYYPMDKSEAPQGFYISPVIKYRIFNYEYISYVESIESARGYKNQLSFTFNFGKQLWLSKSFSLDMYTGVGIGHQLEKTLNVYTDYNYETGETTNYWKYNKYSNPRYFMNLGIKVGIGH